MILESPLILHPSQRHRPRPTLRFEEDERFIEEQILTCTTGTPRGNWIADGMLGCPSFATRGRWMR